MKLSILIATSTAACSHGFVVLETTKTGAYAQSASSLGQQMNGFLNEKKQSKIMKKEDEAEWVGDGAPKNAGGWNPFGKQKAKGAPEPKKRFTPKGRNQEPMSKEAPKKESGGFKFPWVK
jgi:hypothetical protein